MIRFTRDHQYIRVEGGTGTVGITRHAQDRLGDVVFVDLPALGRRLVKGEDAAIVESVKAASEVFAPVSGTVTAVNAGLADAPGAVNEDPAGEGWFFRLDLADPAELDGLMDEAAYEGFLASSG